jgi:hypothetical protein
MGLRDAGIVRLHLGIHEEATPRIRGDQLIEGERTGLSGVIAIDGVADARVRGRGANFGLSAGVTVGGQACASQSQTHGEAVCETPPGSGAANPVVIDVAGQSAQSPFSFAYLLAAAPALGVVGRVALVVCLAAAAVRGRGFFTRR